MSCLMHIYFLQHSGTCHHLPDTSTPQTSTCLLYQPQLPMILGWVDSQLPNTISNQQSLTANPTPVFLLFNWSIRPFFSLSPPSTIGLPGICPLHSLYGPIHQIWARLFYFVMHMKSCLLNQKRHQLHSENIIILLSDISIISILECSDFTLNIHVFLCSQYSITLQMVHQ